VSKLREPPSGELREVRDVPEAFAELVATEFLAARTRREGRFSMAVSGGDTARACYERLAMDSSIDWSSVDLFLGDERCVPADDVAANQRLVRESLVVPTGGVARLTPMCCDDPAAYAATIARLGEIDLVHLGLGPDGHTASLFPGSAALEAPGEALVLASEDPTGRNPYPRMTLTLPAIALGRLVVFTVAGPTKHGALERILGGEDLPAARVRAARVIWLCDRGAMQG
jgi:6-phosphogluconolactonase